MLAEQRYIKIMEKLSNEEIVKTSQLKVELNASSETIRKDLAYLEKTGHLVRVHGGAMIKTPTAKAKQEDFVSFGVRQSQNTDMKMSIALAATSLIKEGQSIALDSGTTSFEVAKILKQKFNNLTIITNSLMNAIELVDKPGFTIITTGGILTPDEHSFISDFATLILDHVNIDTMFLTTCGVSLKNGVTDQRIDEVKIHNKMMQASKQVIVLADSTKFEEVSLIRVCDLKDISVIVTDKNIDSTLAYNYKKQGHNIIVANPL